MNRSTIENVAHRVTKMLRERRLPYRLKHRLGFLGTLPDFIIAGAQKSGTTTLYLSLMDTRYGYAPDQREIHFFSYNYEDGLEWYRARFPAHVLRIYQTRFRRVPFLTGESGPNYLIDPRAPKRIHTHLPKVKIIILLREPIERAYSHYCMNVRHKNETLSFAEAIAMEENRIGAERDRWLADPSSYQAIPPNLLLYSYLYRGVYADILEPWLSTIPSERLLIIKSEDLWEDISVYHRVLDFLELPYNGQEHYENRYYGKGKEAPKKPEIDPKLRLELERYFAPHNRRLAGLLGPQFRWTPTPELAGQSFP